MPAPTSEQILDAVQRQMEGTHNPGFCLACGEEVDGCEPDARSYDCASCGGVGTVFGAEELLLMGHS